MHPTAREELRIRFKLTVLEYANTSMSQRHVGNLEYIHVSVGSEYLVSVSTELFIVIFAMLPGIALAYWRTRKASLQNLSPESRRWQA